MGYKRRTGFIGGKAQAFVDSVFPACPFCKGNPYWETKAAYGLTDYRMKFRCSNCKSICSISLDDLTGFSDKASNWGCFAWLYLWPVLLWYKALRLLKGQSKGQKMIKIEKIGSQVVSPYVVPQEIPMEELQQRMYR